MKIILKGNPQSTNHLYKPARNHRGVYMTLEGKIMKTMYQWEAKRQWQRPVFEGNLKVEIKLFFKDERRRDWDNWHKISMDALTGIVWKDDSQITKATVEKNIDKLNPRIEIIIT
jgi:Holliday junction resolvase RusA-like endonuclease